ncbi:Uncharacterised protein [Mycobacterium tuberculosis]|uniref:Uncharacterized protein n=1 Tax=Cytobacillus oceanisediminis TaxID=665099 RepID=A0ABX3CX24_9BACI|nr:hypothetical protein BBV17_12915 [Cytobacillus oceanisediminis]SGI96554.1 Uncharacterised protein [Mycobacterium tuberculosis]
MKPKTKSVERKRSPVSPHKAQNQKLKVEMVVMGLPSTLNQSQHFSTMKLCKFMRRQKYLARPIKPYV